MGFNTSPTCGITIFVKGALSAQFSRIFPRGFRDFGAHIFGTETDINKGLKAFFSVFHIS